ncbi:pentatricopeptide repeat-containing protein At2g17033-like [Wolffia australiana]
MPSLGLGLGLGLGPALSAAIVVAGDRSKPGRKHAERFLSSLASISTTIDPPHSPSSSSSSSLDRLSRKFLASCPKSAHAGALSHLISLSLSHSSSLSRLAALSLYRQLAASPHFPPRSPQLAPDLVPFLHEMGLSPDAQSLLSDAESRLNSRPEEIHALYCRLIEAFARRGMRESIFLLPRDRRSDDECMIKAFCLLGSPAEAQQVLTQMESPSPFHHRLVLQCYGEMGMTSAMEAMIGSGKVPLDTVCCNVVLSCYGRTGC